MKIDQYGQIIFSEQDLLNLIMEGNPVNQYSNVFVDSSVNLESIKSLQELESLKTWTAAQDLTQTVEEFDHTCQQQWLMPAEYQNLDIAEYVLNLCQNQAQLQRVGAELLLYQEKNLFDLLRYLKYLVDTMTQNNIIWGVGRGSCVSSYVLFLLGVHKIDSLYYDLDPKEFLR